MNGQYLMNKEISVQYAYKKDGKGERHGDQAERMLAAQARKHNIQPNIQPLPFPGIPPGVPLPVADTDGGRTGSIGAFLNGRGGASTGNYQNMPSAQPQRPPPPSQPLPAPPSGLPARPPPSQAGYGGPQSFLPPGFSGPPQQNFPPSSAAGFAPPSMPPGFQQPAYGRAR